MEGEGVGGRLRVPWISRIARPEGVWRSWGRGFGEEVSGVRGVRWRGIVGMVVVGEGGELMVCGVLVEVH